MPKSSMTVETEMPVISDTPAERFAQINASNRLEGIEATPELLAIQKSIISGDVSIADAIRAMRVKHGLPVDGATAPRAEGRTANR